MRSRSGAFQAPIMSDEGTWKEPLLERQLPFLTMKDTSLTFLSYTRSALDQVVGETPLRMAVFGMKPPPVSCWCNDFASWIFNSFWQLWAGPVIVSA